MKKVALIDLDTPVYAAASAVTTRSVLVTHEPTQKKKEFSTRTEFKEMLKSKNKLDKLDDYSFLDQQESEPVENACRVLKTMVKWIVGKIQPDEVQYYISGKGNFRDNLELPTRYKSGRANMIRPTHLADVRRFATHKFHANVCDAYEPDDAIVINGYSVKNDGNKPVIVTIDKDALAYSGLYLFNQDKPELGEVLLPGLGSLWIDNKNKVRGNGFLWYCLQHTTGDRTDTFVPTDLCDAKFGEKSAYKLLKDCATEREALEAVLTQYKKWYPSPVTYTAWNGKEHTKDYIEIAQLYFRCARMMEHEFDDLNFIEFCNQHGVSP